MKNNKSVSKSSEVRKSRCEKLSTHTDGDKKKGRKTKKKIQKATTSSRESFQAILPGIRYCNGQWIKKETIEVLDVRVVKSAGEDMEGIGYERLVLWKMSAGETEELKQQVKQEALHKKRENIMPLVLQMSSDQIETAYEGIIKQWNVPDDLVSDECEGDNNSGENTSDDEEDQFEEQLPKSAEVFSLESHASRQLVSEEAVCLEPANGDNSQIVLQSCGESPVATQIRFPGADFIAPLLIKNSLVAESKTLSDEFSRKFEDSNSEVVKCKETVSEPVSDKYQLNDCNSHSEGNQSMPRSGVPNLFVTNDHGFADIRTTISVAEICISDSATAAANDTCNTEIPEINNDLNFSPKLIKRKRSTKAEYAKKMKFYIDDLPCLVSESLKTQNQDVVLTTDHASDKNSAVTPTNTCPNIACPIDPIIQAVAPNKESGLECAASIKESSTSVSINCSSDVKRSQDNKVGKRTKDLTLDHRRSRNKSNIDQVNLEPKLRCRLKPMEAQKNVVSFWQPTFVKKSVPDMSNPDLDSGKMKNVSEHIDAYGPSRRKERKPRNCALVESRCKDLAKDCDDNMELAQKNHLNLALDKNKMSGKVTRASSRAMAKSRYQVEEKDVHVSEDVSQQSVLGCKKSVSKCLKEKHVSELIKQKPNTEELLTQEESKVKDVIPLDSDLGQKYADESLNHVLEEDTINTNKRNPKKSVSKCPKNTQVITVNNANLRRVKAVKNKEKKELANDLKHCQPQVCKNNRNTKTNTKSSPCGIKVDVRCRNLGKSATMCNKIGTRSRNSKTKDRSQDADLHHTENFTSTGRRKVTKKDRVLRQSEIIESCSNTNFASRNLNNSCAKVIQNRKNKKLCANDSGPSQTEVIESSSKTNDLGMLQTEVADVNSGSREDTFSISANSSHKHEKAHKGTSNKLRRKSSDEKDSNRDTKSQENLGERKSLSTQNELDEKLRGHISVDTEKTELDDTNHASTELEKTLKDKMPCSETKNDAETDKPEVLTKCSVKLKTGKYDSQKEKNCCNTAVAPIAEKLVVHVADDPTSRSLNHNNIQHDHVSDSLNICGSGVEEQAKGDPLLTAHDEHDKEHVSCKPVNSSCHSVSHLIVARETDLEELRCPPQLIAADDSIDDRDEHLLSLSKDDNSEVKCDSCASSDASKNDCSATRNGNVRFTDYSNGSNNELPDCVPLLSVDVISGINNNCSNKTISPIRSPSPHSSNSPSSKVDLQECINGKRLHLKEPVAIPLTVEDPKVRNLLEYMCKAEILRLLRDD